MEEPTAGGPNKSGGGPKQEQRDSSSMLETQAQSSDQPLSQLPAPSRIQEPDLDDSNLTVFSKPTPQSVKLLTEQKPSGSGADNQNSTSQTESRFDVAVSEEGSKEGVVSAMQEKVDNRKKTRNRSFRGQQGKTMYPRTRSTSKEMRELSRKHALLEKNLKIDGLPDPPKFRKRRLSLSSNMGRAHDKDVPYKRKRLASVDTRPRRDHMPKWELMGGDANDPLNLNGLADSEEGRLLNLKTPETSPLPTPDFRKIVYVKVPPNIEDPLNLEGKHDQSVIDKLLNSTIRKRHRSRKKKHDDTQTAATSGTAQTTALPSAQSSASKEESSLISESQTMTKATGDSMETKATDTPTPTKPAAGGGRRSRSRSLSMSPERKFRRQLSGGKGRSGPNEPTKFPENPKFIFGNYNRYYGYRNKDNEPDPRLQYFHPSWFKGKDVLDIGCNVGHITLALAEQFQPHKILGMDIDGKLIQAARQNIRHMLSQRRKDSAKYPRVFEMTRGPLEAHPLMGSSDNFPNNVLFLQGNYVPGSEEILQLQKEEYDTILALSITKWIHLNNGDNGLKLFFQKIFRQLRPGGRLILEPQPWSTYRKRAKLSPELFAKYQSIKLKPEGFKHYLLSIGFVKCEVIGLPVAKAKGFRRPLILFTKADNKQTPSASVGEDIDYRDVCQECGNTDKSQCDHPQFTGMRRGPYASHMYDHINYPYASSDSPYFSSSRAYSSYSYSFNVPGVEDCGIYLADSGSSSYGRGGLRRGESFGNIWDNPVMMNYSAVVNWRNSSDRQSGSGSDRQSGSASDRQSGSASDRQSGSASGSSSVSGSGSGSGGSYSSSSGSSGSLSTRSNSASYYSPGQNGLNGDIANESFSPNPGGPNGDIANEIYSPDPGGPNVGMDDPAYSPNPNGPNGDIVDDVYNPSGPNGDIADDVSSLGHGGQHDDFAEAPHSPGGSQDGIVNDPEWGGNNGDAAVLVEEEYGGAAEGSNDVVEPVHSNNSMNGEHGIDVVPQWDDNQDANLDAPLVGEQPPADIENYGDDNGL